MTSPLPALKGIHLASSLSLLAVFSCPCSLHFLLQCKENTWSPPPVSSPLAIVMYPQEWMSSSVSLAHSNALHDVLFVTVIWLLTNHFVLWSLVVDVGSRGWEGLMDCPWNCGERLHGALCRRGLASGKDTDIKRKKQRSIFKVNMVQGQFSALDSKIAHVCWSHPCFIGWNQTTEHGICERWVSLASWALSMIHPSTWKGSLGADAKLLFPANSQGMLCGTCAL